jgi:hypothetical protein
MIAHVQAIDVGHSQARQLHGHGVELAVIDGIHEFDVIGAERRIVIVRAIHVFNGWICLYSSITSAQKNAHIHIYYTINYQKTCVCYYSSRP